MSAPTALSPPTGTTQNTGNALPLAGALIAQSVMEHGNDEQKCATLTTAFGPDHPAVKAYNETVQDGDILAGSDEQAKAEVHSKLRERLRTDRAFAARVLAAAKARHVSTGHATRTNRATRLWRGSTARTTRTGRTTTARRTAAHKSSTRSTAGASADSDKSGEPPGHGSPRVEPTTATPRALTARHAVLVMGVVA